MFLKKAVSKRSSLTAAASLVMGVWGALSAPAALAEPLDQVQWVQDDINGVDHLACATDTATSPDQRFVYATSGCDDAINIFSRDIDTGRLDLIHVIVADTEAGTGVQPTDDIAISPDGKHLYVSGMTGYPGNTANNFRSAIFVFERDLETGMLTQRQIYDGRGLASALHVMTMSADGKYLYHAGVNSRAITVLKRAANGFLSEVQYIEALPENRAIRAVRELVFSPAQDYLYLGMDTSNNAIVWMKRNATTGELTYAGEISSSTPELANLGAAFNFVISPNGKNLYLHEAGLDNEFLWQFAINPDASLSLAGEYSLPPSNPDTRFYCPEGMNISSNGRLLYFVDSCAGNFQVWGIKGTTGDLTYFDAAQASDTKSISQVERVRLTPDGHFAQIATIWGIEVFELTADSELTLKVPTPVAPGAEFQATLEVLNLGTATAHSVTVSTDLGQSVEFLGAAPSSNTTNCGAAEGKVTCAIGALPDGAMEEIVLTLRLVDTSESPVLTATLSQDEIDPDESNNTRTVALNSEGTDTGPVPGDTAPVTEDSGKSNGGGGSFDSGLLLIFGGLGLLSLVRTRRSQR